MRLRGRCIRPEVVHHFTRPFLRGFSVDAVVPVTGITMPSLRAVGAKAEGIGNVTALAPAGLTAGDGEILVVECIQTETAVLGTPADFVEVPVVSPQVGATTKLHVFTRLWDGSAGDPTVTDPGNHALAYRIALRNVALTGGLIDASAGDIAASGTAISCPGLTTTIANTLVLAICAATTDSDVAQASAASNADLTDVTIIGDLFTSQGGGGGVVVISGGRAVAGPVGATAFTLAAASATARITLAIRGLGSP